MLKFNRTWQNQQGVSKPKGPMCVANRSSSKLRRTKHFTVIEFKKAKVNWMPSNDEVLDN